MKLPKRLRPTKPVQDNGSFEPGGLVGQQGMIRGIRPLSKVWHEAVFLRVVMNVMNEGHKIAVRRDQQAAKMMLKQTAGAPVGFVDGFGVGVQPIVKGVAHGAAIEVETDAVSNPHQQMKVVPQQAVGKCFGHRGNVFGVEFQKIGIVALFDKEVGSVDPAIIDMIVLTRFKGNYGLHCLSPQTDSVSETESVLVLICSTVLDSVKVMADLPRLR